MTVARRLIISIVGFSILVTLVSTGIQLFIDYNNDVKQIEKSIEQIKTSRVPLLALNIWVLDEEQIVVLLDSLIHIPNIEHVEIRNNNTTRWEAGSKIYSSGIEETFSLTFTNKGKLFDLGELVVIAGLDNVFAELRNRAFIILASNAVVISLIAGFFLFIFQYQISRHLITLSAFARDVTLGNRQPLLKLGRNHESIEQQDELDEVVSALNLMRTNIETSFEALRDSEQHNRMLFDQSPVGLALSNQEGQILDANPAYSRIVGYSSEELVNKSFWDLTATDFWESEKQQLGLLKTKGHTGPYEKQTLHKDGHEILVQISCHLLEKEGEPLIWASIEDITERKETAEALRKSEEQLRQSEKMRAVGELTGGVAHDFNNLLAVVLGNAELIEENLEGNEKLKPLLSSLILATTRGAELTQRLLAFSRKQMLNPKIIDSGELIDGMTDMLSRTLGETIEVKTVHAPDLWPCIIDPGQLENAILNLAINSRDAMPDGGVLTIETANTAFDNPLSAGNDEIESGDYVAITVSDTGLGMAQKIVDRAFEPFFTTKAVGAGTGLGLSMIYGFIQQSGGRVSIYSEENVGTSVTMCLPRSDEATSRKGASMGTLNQKTGQEKILILEDDPDVRELTILQLSSLGYEVLEAEDGNTALSILKADDSIDLLLSDVVLPGGLRGPEVAQKAREFSPDLKVLFMSGYTQNALDSHSALAEAAQLLNKPFRKKDLGDRIREILEQN